MKLVRVIYYKIKEKIVNNYAYYYLVERQYASANDGKIEFDSITQDEYERLHKSNLNLNGVNYEFKEIDYKDAKLSIKRFLKDKETLYIKERLLDLPSEIKSLKNKLRSDRRVLREKEREIEKIVHVADGKNTEQYKKIKRGFDLLLESMEYSELELDKLYNEQENLRMLCILDTKVGGLNE